MRKNILTEDKTTKKGIYKGNRLWQAHRRDRNVGPRKSSRKSPGR